VNNYHTHTYLCKHAEGEVHQYVSEAVKIKSIRIGISDHTPLPDNRWLHHRMEMDELDGYMQEIEDAPEKLFLILRYYPDLNPNMKMNMFLCIFVTIQPFFQKIKMKLILLGEEKHEKL